MPLGVTDLEAVVPQGINGRTLRRVRDACSGHQCLAAAPAITPARSQNKGHAVLLRSTFIETWRSGSRVGRPKENRTISDGAPITAGSAGFAERVFKKIGYSMAKGFLCHLVKCV